MTPTLDLVSLDTAGWLPHQQTPTQRSWYVEGDPVLLRLMAQSSPESTVEGWRVRAAHETEAAGGTCLSFDEERVDGCLAFRGVFKFPAARCVPGLPAESLAVYIVGLLVVPLGAFHLLVNFEALERGATGSREAVVALATQPKPGAPSVNAGGFEEYQASFRRALAMALPSDAPEFDEALPTHPLSRVRARQRRLVEMIRLDERLKALAGR